MNEIAAELEKTILTKKRFSKLIEDKMTGAKLSYIDAVIGVCTDLDIDPLDVGNLVTPIIRDKIEAEAIDLNMLKGGNKLPL
jgi:hypothetical protein